MQQRVALALALLANNRVALALKDDEAVRQGLPLVHVFNQRDELGEQSNRQAEKPERVRRMLARLRQIVADGRSPPPRPPPGQRCRDRPLQTKDPAGSDNGADGGV